MMIYKLLKKVQVLTLTLLVLVSYPPIKSASNKNSPRRSSKKIPPSSKSKRTRQSTTTGRISRISNKIHSNKSNSSSPTSSRASSVSRKSQFFNMDLTSLVDKLAKLKDSFTREEIQDLLQTMGNIDIGIKAKEMSMQDFSKSLAQNKLTINNSQHAQGKLEEWLEKQFEQAFPIYINKQAPNFAALLQNNQITLQDINTHFPQAISQQEEKEQDEEKSGSEETISMDKLCEKICLGTYELDEFLKQLPSVEKSYAKPKLDVINHQEEEKQKETFKQNLKQSCGQNKAFITRIEKGEDFPKEQVAEILKALNIAEQTDQDLTTDQLWKKLYNNKDIALQNPAALNNVIKEIEAETLRKDEENKKQKEHKDALHQADIDKISNQHASSKQKLENERKRLSAENKKVATDLVNAKLQANTSKFDNHKKLIITTSVAATTLMLIYAFKDYIAKSLFGEKHPAIKTSIQKGIFASSAKRKSLPDRGKDLILAPKDRKELQNIYDTLKQRKKNKQVAMHHKLIAGQPGNGKTTIAQSIIAKGHNECNFDYICLDARQLARRNQKEQIAVLDNALITAKKHPRPVILFIDEVEALFPKRGTSEHLTNVVSVLLTHVQETFDKSFMIIAITNYPDILDAAVSDRLEFWKIDPPNIERRCKIFNGYVEKFIIKKGISIQAPVSLEDKKGQAFIKSLRDVSPRTIKGAVVKTATNLLIKKTKGPIDVIEEVGKVLKLQEKKENPIKKTFRKLKSRLSRRR